METAHGTTGITLIAAERERQVTSKGFDARHDAHHPDSELTAAATCYAVASDGVSLDPNSDYVPSAWPWDLDEFRPDENPIKNLVTAGALIAAEIDRRLLAAEVSGAEVRQREAEEAPIFVLALGGEAPRDADHVHDVEGRCVKDRGGKCTAPRLVGGPYDAALRADIYG